MGDFDREKVIECMFDPVTSAILAGLEDGQKTCSFLARQASVPEHEVLARLSYLIEHGFVIHTAKDGACMLAADPERLSGIIENGENFEDAISGLEKMDSYLN